MANGVGNLLSRTVAMIRRYFDGAIPPVGQVTDAETPVVAAASDLQAAATPAMEICAFHTYLDKVVTLVAATDKYIDTTEPFKLAKDQRQRDRLGAILYTCVEAVRIVLLYLGPVMPESAETEDLQVSHASLQLIYDGMSAVVNERGGTAYQDFGPAGLARQDVKVYGKTGSTERPENAWFAGFAEDAEGAKIAIAVVVEGGQHGSSDAAPLAREIIQLCVEAGYVGTRSAIPVSR